MTSGDIGTEGKKTALVGIFNLQVILAPDGDSWIAQALELDYAAAGDNLEDAKRHFESGLLATLQEHFRIFGDLDKFLERKPARENLLSLMKIKAKAEYYSQVSMHEYELPPEFGDVQFPFANIRYYSPPVAA